jgi:hypothetical protein
MEVPVTLVRQKKNRSPVFTEINVMDLNFIGFIHVGPTVLSLGLTTIKTLWLMNSANSANSLLRRGQTFDFNLALKAIVESRLCSVQ